MTPTPTSAPSILLVDDDDVFRHRLARAFADRGFTVREAADLESALAAAAEESAACAVVDLRLGGDSGLDVVRELRRLSPSIVIVVLTGYGSIATALEAIRLGATHYLTKPATVEEILAGFSRALPEAPPTPVADDSVPSLARVEWEHINRVLADVDGNVSEAARRLGLHRRSLQRKLFKHPQKR